MRWLVTLVEVVLTAPAVRRAVQALLAAIVAALLAHIGGPAAAAATAPLALKLFVS